MIWEHDLTENIKVEVEGSYYRGQNYQVTPVTIQPPDPPELTIKHIWLGHGENRVDVYKAFADDTLEEITHAIMLDMEDDF